MLGSISRYSLEPSKRLFTMPSQWELETEGRLGSIDAKLDTIIGSLDRGRAAQQDADRRLGSLERWRARWGGVVAGLSIVSFVFAFLGLYIAYVK